MITDYLTKNKIGQGYDKRQKNVKPTKAILHTTNGNCGSSFNGEANFLRDSKSVKAHFLVGKEGQVGRILPIEYRAWHAGASVQGWNNNDTVGIEVHQCTRDGAWSSKTIEALEWLFTEHLKITGSSIEMHRVTAIPRGRKIDPSGITDSWFYNWRSKLANKPAPPVNYLKTFQVIYKVNVREGPSTKKPIALNGKAVLEPGFTFQSDVTVTGEQLSTGNKWIHMVTPAEWGFVHESCVLGR